MENGFDRSREALDSLHQREIAGAKDSLGMKRTTPLRRLAGHALCAFVYLVMGALGSLKAQTELVVAADGTTRAYSATSAARGRARARTAPA